MAPLASIDEARDASQPEQAHTELHKQEGPEESQQTRPQSRVIFVASRHPRIRSHNRKTLLAKRRKGTSPKDSKEEEELPGNPATCRSTGENHHEGKESEAPFEMPSDSGAGSEPPDEPFDLDSFPVPPSASANMYPPHTGDGKSQKINAAEAQQSLSANSTQAIPSKLPRAQSSQAPPSIAQTAKQAGNPRWPGDATDDRPDTPQLSSADSALVTAISRNIAEQLHLLSMNRSPAHDFPSKEPWIRSSEDLYRGGSRTSSQRVNLELFTRDIQRYADNMGARGKVLNFTPTPTRSGATLRTVSALMPFRPEFREAGLADGGLNNRRRHRLPPAARFGRPKSGRFPVIPSVNGLEFEQPARRPYQSLPSQRLAQALSRDYLYAGHRANHSVPELLSPTKPLSGEAMVKTVEHGPQDAPAPDASVSPTNQGPGQSTLRPALAQEARGNSQESKALLDSRRPTVPKRTSSIREGRRQMGRSHGYKITDRDVLRGLNVAASAACDEDVDAYVRHKTGLQIRRFLADLVVLETLGDENPSDTTDIIMQRRVDMKRLKQHVRRTRELKRLSGVASERNSLITETKE
ncbi:hypothetical protein HJFPF1_01519 [Paramyrothecium foliicola]|nr:hypothetical protein HJFPF1_01519 [Paramyrothecium foliicola]